MVKKQTAKHPKKSSRHQKLDVMVLAAIITPALTLPQIYSVWQGDASGVSLVTWGAYLLMAGIWLSYGLRERLFPIIVLQVAWVVVDSSMVLGIIFIN